MSEKRFPADGIVGIIVWSPGFPGSLEERRPYIRLYEPRDPETGGARPPEGGHCSFKDYKMATMTDPSIRIVDSHGAFEFIEKENGECWFDFSLRALGKE